MLLLSLLLLLLSLLLGPLLLPPHRRHVVQHAADMPPAERRVRDHLHMCVCVSLSLSIYIYMYITCYIQITHTSLLCFTLLGGQIHLNKEQPDARKQNKSNKQHMIVIWFVSPLDSRFATSPRQIPNRHDLPYLQTSFSAFGKRTQHNKKHMHTDTHTTTKQHMWVYIYIYI